MTTCHKMIGRGLLALALLSNCVLSLPVTSSQLENEDAKVMKCIVEALADVVSRSHPLPVSPECLVTLKTDDRLVSILRHHSFLRELQDIALEGDKERAEQQNVPSTQTPLAASEVADRSMLEALGSPGERSILSEKKRRTGTGDGEEGKPASFLEEESQAGRSSQEKTQREADKRRGRKEDGEKRADSEEGSNEEKKGSGSAEKRHAPTNKWRAKTLNRDEDKDKRSFLFSHQQEEKQDSGEVEEDEEVAKRGGVESSPWTKREKTLPVKKEQEQQEQEEEKVAAEAQQLSSQQEVPHHSKELSQEEEVVKKDRDEEDEEEGQKKKKKKKKRNWRKTAEEKELQMIASKQPEEKRASEEEGSASRKSEEQEIESLAAIESELENVAQKLHDLRRG